MKTNPLPRHHGYLMMAAACAVALGLGSPALRAEEPKLSINDKIFLDLAAAGGHHEVALGKIAQQKATSEQAKALASQLVASHTKISSEVAALAAKKGTDVPKDTNLLQKGNLKVFEMSTEGAKFDGEFMSRAALDHRGAISSFEDAIKETKDPDLKAFAESTLPVLKKNLSMAESKEAAAKDQSKSQ